MSRPRRTRAAAQQLYQSAARQEIEFLAYEDPAARHLALLHRKRQSAMRTPPREVDSDSDSDNELDINFGEDKTVMTTMPGDKANLCETIKIEEPADLADDCSESSDVSVFDAWVPRSMNPQDYDGLCIPLANQEPIPASAEDQIGEIFSCELSPSMASGLPWLSNHLRRLQMRHWTENGELYVEMNGPYHIRETAKGFINEVRTGLPWSEVKRQDARAHVFFHDMFCTICVPAEDFLESARLILSRKHRACIVRNHLTSQNGGLALAIRKVTSTSISIEGNLLRFTGLLEKDVLETQHLLKRLLNGEDRRRKFDDVLKQAKEECEARGEVVDLNILQNLKFQK